MNQLSVPLPELARIFFLDVFSTIVLFWALAAVLLRTEKARRSIAALALALAAAVTLDALTGGWGIWKRPAVAAVGIIHVAVIQTIRLRWRKVRVDADDTVPEVFLTVAGWLILGISVAGAAYCGVRDIPRASGYFGRLCFGYLFALLFFGILVRPSLMRRRRTLALVLTCVLGVAVAVRAGAWVRIWKNPESALSIRVIGNPQPGTPFPRLASLIELRRALAAVDEDLPAAVEHFRLASRVANAEWWLRGLPDWIREPVEFPLALALGTSVSLERSEQAIALGLDNAGSRFLVFTDRGRLVSTGNGTANLTIVDFTPVDLCVTASGAVVVLGENGEFARAHPSGGVEQSRLTGGPFRGAACSGETISAVRADGSVVRSTAGVIEEPFAPIWPDSDEAVDVAAVPGGEGVYILDGHGGLHPRGATAIRKEDLAGHEDTIHYWPRTQPAAGIDVTKNGAPVYADAYGGIHAVVREAGGVRHTGNRFPLLDKPLVVDLLVEESFSAVYLLTREGDILVVPEYGWLGSPKGEEEP